MANFELLGGISFDKGCYTGQEVVAACSTRKLKRRMFLANVALMQGGDPLYSEDLAIRRADRRQRGISPDGGYDCLRRADREP